MAIVSKAPSKSYDIAFDRIFKKLSATTDFEARTTASRRANGERREPIQKIVDESGSDVTKSSRAKNRMYSEAKALREELKSVLLTKSEAWNPTDGNVEKMLRSEMSPRGSEIYSRYRNLMRAQGATSSEYDQNKIRRQR